MNKSINNGCYPVMLVAYDKNGNVDYNALRGLIKWYWDAGCHGIFSVCHSTEMRFLSLEERVGIARFTKQVADELAATDKSRPPMSIVASGHISDALADQAYEMNKICETGVDGAVFTTNRFDIPNEDEDRWIDECAWLLTQLPEEIPLGFYETPMPYKRLLTDKMCKFLADSGRFAFIKDTCCDMDMIARRLEIFKGSSVGLFNANGQTALDSLKIGAKGYSGIMANFHPKLYSWLCDNWDKQPELAEKIADFCAISSFVENPVYPCTAKYGLSAFANVPIEWSSRQADVNNLTDYQKRWVKRLYDMSAYYESLIK